MSKQDDSINEVETSRSKGLAKFLSTGNHHDFFQNWGPARLRVLFLLPMSFAYFWIVLVLSILLYQYSKEVVDKDVMRISVSAQEFYEEGVRYDSRALQAMMHSLQHDEALHHLLKAKDKRGLLEHATPLYKQLNEDFSITHMYFTGVDRVNLLRVHAPARSGGVIDRITMKEAQRTGMISAGVELGPLGTLTLRLVSPWYDEAGQLIGYVEIGMEVDQVLNQIRQLFGIQVQVLVKKQFLEQTTWESGMRSLGRTPLWDRFSGVVVNEPLRNDISQLVLEPLTNGKQAGSDSTIELMLRGFSYRVVAIPILDLGGRHVADMALISDVSVVEHTARKTAAWGGAIALVVGAFLLIFFYWLVGRIGRHIERDHMLLEELATHDGLTELYNHRMFYQFLTAEVERVKRYNRPVSLLMLDIDLFKGVNDNYGHRAGDMILHGLSQLLMRQMRAIDYVCRYGGEEIGIILLESDAEVAIETAERLRKLIEQNKFDIDEGQKLSVTVSIGVTTCSIDKQVTASKLVSQADEALYSAKEGGRNKAVVFE